MTPDFWRGLRLALLIVAPFWAAVGWGVHHALAAPSIHAVAADAVTFVERSQHVEIPARPVVITAAPRAGLRGTAAETDGRTVWMRPRVALEARGPRWRDDPAARELIAGSEVLLHEIEHSEHGVRCADRHAEEGIAQALALDRLTAFMWQRYRLRVRLPRPGTGMYADAVRDVRAASALLAGASWRSRAAREVRIAMRQASCEQRAAMFARAAEARRG